MWLVWRGGGEERLRYFVVRGGHGCVRAWMRACVVVVRKREGDELTNTCRLLTSSLLFALVIVHLVVFGHPMALLPPWTHFLAACRSHGLRDFSAPTRRRLRPDTGREMKQGGRRQRQKEEAGAATPHVEEAEGDEPIEIGARCRPTSRRGASAKADQSHTHLPRTASQLLQSAPFYSFPPSISS